MGTAREVFGAFLKLGVTSFGGPIAHLGYFRDELVTRRGWVDDRQYADLVALCQFLPGPASSQVGFALGLRRAGWRGAIAAWAAFTLPSAMLMVAFAYGALLLTGPLGVGILDGLKVVAVAIVAQAVWGMARTLTPDVRRASIAVAALAVALAWPGSLGQIVAIAVGAVAGLWLCRAVAAEQSSGLGMPVSRRAGILSLILLGALLVALPTAAAATSSVAIDVADGFARAGALVFGGGHVVLPLLESEATWVTSGEFLAGYGAAQAVPGPLFTFAAYLGALAMPGAAGLATAAIALVAVFVPGLLLLVAILPFWQALHARPAVRAAVTGASAAVVGILAAALYDPLFTTAVTDAARLALAAVCTVLLLAWRTPPWIVVLVGAAGGALLTLL